MKTLTRILMVMTPAIITFISSGQNTEQITEKPFPAQYGSLDYWKEKIQDKNSNIYDFKNEFLNYWKDKTPEKGSGYKQGSICKPRWQLAIARRRSSAGNGIYAANQFDGNHGGLVVCSAISAGLSIRKSNHFYSSHGARNHHRVLPA